MQNTTPTNTITVEPTDRGITSFQNGGVLLVILIMVTGVVLSAGGSVVGASLSMKGVSVEDESAIGVSVVVDASLSGRGGKVEGLSISGPIEVMVDDPSEAIVDGAVEAMVDDPSEAIVDELRGKVSVRPD